MRKVNLITKKQADARAQNYFENSKVPSLYVTRDGQIFLKGSENYMRMHEKDCKLDASWPYSRDAEKAVEKKAPKSKEEDKKVNVNNMSLQALRTLANDLTSEGTIKKEDWEKLEYKDLKKFLKDK